MVNCSAHAPRPATSAALPMAAVLVPIYLAVVVSTLLTLIVLTITAPPLATATAWGHAIVVALFAILLPLRLRRAQTGQRGAIRAVGLIAAVLFLVNVVEVLIPAFVPVWMRIEMVVVAVLMIGVVADVVRRAVVNKN